MPSAGGTPLISCAGGPPNQSQVDPHGCGEAFDWHHTLEVRVPFTVTLFIISASAIVCNLLVLVTLARTRRLRHMNTRYLANMAFVDLSIASLVIPTALYQCMVDTDEFEPTFCKVFALVWNTLSKSSVLTVAAIAFDRHQAVINCLRYTTAKRKHLGITWIWAQSLLFSLPPLMGWSRFEYLPDRFLCTIDWDYSWSYTMFVFVTCYLMPLGLVLVCYARVWYTARQHVKRLAASQRERERSSSSFSLDTEEMDRNQKASLKRRSSVFQYAVVDPIHRVSMYPSIQQWGNNHIRSDLYTYTGIRALYNLEGTEGGPAGGFRSHYRASFRLALQVLVLILCWFPLFGVTLVGLGGIEVQGIVISVFTCVSFAGAVTNPIIYALGSRTFRHALRRLPHCSNSSNSGRSKRHDIVVEQIANLYSRKSLPDVRSSISAEVPSEPRQSDVNDADDVRTWSSPTSGPFVISSTLTDNNNTYPAKDCILNISGL